MKPTMKSIAWFVGRMLKYRTPGPKGYHPVIEGHHSSATIENGIIRDQPFRLIGHDDGRAISGIEVRILERPRQGKRDLFEVGIGEADLLPITLGLNQAALTGEAVQRVAQS